MKDILLAEKEIIVFYIHEQPKKVVGLRLHNFFITLKRCFLTLIFTLTSLF